MIRVDVVNHERRHILVIADQPVAVEIRRIHQRSFDEESGITDQPTPEYVVTIHDPQTGAHLGTYDGQGYDDN